jgi:hypothetical protein
MIHVLNNLPTDYDLQLALLKKKIGDKDDPLTVEEIRADLSLRYEILNMKSTQNEKNKEFEENVLFRGKFKGKYRNCGWIGHDSLLCKSRSSQNSRNNGKTTGESL